MKDAYADAQTGRTVGPVLHKVFQKTFQAAKQVRTQTAIAEGQVSIANVAVDLAKTIFGDLADARVLLAGAGEIGEQAAKAFRSRGTTDITVTSRTMERAMSLAGTLDSRALPFDKIAHHIGDFDVVDLSLRGQFEAVLGVLLVGRLDLLATTAAAPHAFRLDVGQ